MSGKYKAEEEDELHTRRKAGWDGLGLLRGFFFFPFLKTDSRASPAAFSLAFSIIFLDYIRISLIILDIVTH